jgi:hypothetical protein
MWKSLVLAVAMAGVTACGSHPDAGNSQVTSGSAFAGRTLTDFAGAWKGRGLLVVGGTSSEKEITLKIIYDAYYQDWSVKMYADGGSGGGYNTSNIGTTNEKVFVRCYNPSREPEIGQITGDTLHMHSEYEIGCQKVAASFRASLRPDGRLDISANLAKNRQLYSTMTTTLTKQ